MKVAFLRAVKATAVFREERAAHLPRTIAIIIIIIIIIVAGSTFTAAAAAAGGVSCATLHNRSSRNATVLEQAEWLPGPIIPFFTAIFIGTRSTSLVASVCLATRSGCPRFSSPWATA